MLTIIIYKSLSLKLPYFFEAIKVDISPIWPTTAIAARRY